MHLKKIPGSVLSQYGKNIRVMQYSFSLPHLCRPVTLLLASDFHCGKMLAKDLAPIGPFITNVAQREEVHAIVIPGDIGDRLTPCAEWIPIAAETFAPFCHLYTSEGRPIPVLISPGNHDVLSDKGQPPVAQKFTSLYQGVKEHTKFAPFFLHPSPAGYPLRDAVTLMAAPDAQQYFPYPQVFSNKRGLKEYIMPLQGGTFLGQAQPADFPRLTIALSHNPDGVYAPDPPGTIVELVVSGHTHGGQMPEWLAKTLLKLPVIGGKLAAEFPPSSFGLKSGAFQVNSRILVISNGIVTKPFRLLCPPEIAVIRLLPSKSD